MDSISANLIQAGQTFTGHFSTCGNFFTQQAQYADKKVEAPGSCSQTAITAALDKPVKFKNPRQPRGQQPSLPFSIYIKQ